MNCTKIHRNVILQKLTQVGQSICTAIIDRSFTDRQLLTDKYTSLCRILVQMASKVILWNTTPSRCNAYITSIWATVQTDPHGLHVATIIRSTAQSSAQVYGTVVLNFKLLTHWQITAHNEIIHHTHTANTNITPSLATVVITTTLYSTHN